MSTKYTILCGTLRELLRTSFVNIRISGHTYKLAWSTFEARFDKSRLIACSSVANLLRVPFSEFPLLDFNIFMAAFVESVTGSLQTPNLGDFTIIRRPANY